MPVNELLEYLLKTKNPPEPLDEAAAYEASSLVSGTTLKFYAHYINTEALTQLQNLEEQNISHLGITAEELQQVVFRGAQVIEKSSVAQTIDAAIAKSKNQPPWKSVAQVLSVCEDILCQPMDSLTAQEKEILLGVMAQYTVMKRRYQEQDRAEKAKKAKER